MAKRKCPDCLDTGIRVDRTEKYCHCPAATEYKAAMAETHETLGRAVVPPATPETKH